MNELTKTTGATTLHEQPEDFLDSQIEEITENMRISMQEKDIDTYMKLTYILDKLLRMRSKYDKKNKDDKKYHINFVLE